jgi:hypothetical protein
MGVLTFVPPNKVPACFDPLLEELKDDVLDLPDCIQKTYARDRTVQKRRYVVSPTYP